MTKRLTAREEFQQRLAHVTAKYPSAASLLQKESTHQTLWGLSAHDSRVAWHVLDLCRPALGEVQDTFLSDLYTHLSDNLFPDEALGCLRRPFSWEEELYLDLFSLVLSHQPETFDPLLDVIPLEEAQITGSRVEGPYRRFVQAVEEEHLLALMHLGRGIMPFDPASHTIGVHNIALHTAQMAVKAGIPVDLPLVSGAALGHDIGKFGCRGEDARRIPYLHYYYTWQWFRERDMEEIGYISANHSTWDLEFENLPIESLLLIYADFRVRGTRDEEGQEHMAIYSLLDAYEMVFSKLYNMTPEKQRRYETVYYKLRDFEQYLRENGVPVDLTEQEIAPIDRRDPSLLSPAQALGALRSMTLSNAIGLMRTVSGSESFAKLLEQAKSGKNLPSIRTYLHLLEEYSTYMTAGNKQKTLALLYELLMHPEGDVRRKAGQIMGQILANSGPKYRKERPVAAREDVMTPTMMALLEESVSLWDAYILRCLHPDRKVSAKHAQRISNALKTICKSLFAHCSQAEAQPLLQPLLQRLWEAQGEDRAVLVDALYQVPWSYLPEESLAPTVAVLGEMLEERDVRFQLAALRCLEQLRRTRPSVAGQVIALAEGFVPPAGEHFLVLDGMRRRVLDQMAPELSGEEISDLYLSDLKNAVPWTVKLIQIDLICDQVLRQPERAFHTAMHLSNLLSVSEHLPVREYAGQKLLTICPHLTVTQINEITIDLLRELESGQEQISRFIPPYVGQIMCMLPEKEFLEALLLLEDLVRGTSVRPARAALYTLGEILCVLPDQTATAHRVLSILLTGISHYEGTIHRTALTVLCREVFGSDRLPLERKRDYFLLLHKKLLTILAEPREDELTFFNRAAMLNHLYRFLVRCEVELGPFPFPARKPAAFFPGTFDPFSVGHKRIVEEIRALGFEVYLAVDEFSWSKRTLAKLMRRQIVVMSVADQWDTYLFPDDIPINLASPEDLAHLRQLLGEQELYLVAGNDVIHNASAYRSQQEGAASAYNHIVFYRGTSQEEEELERAALQKIIGGKLLLLSLPPFYDTVSSTRIRESVDQNLDISMLVDPVVQSYIYQYGLYVRSPERKSVLRRQDMYFRSYRGESQELPQAMNRLLRQQSPLGTVLRLRPNTLMGWAVGHTLRVTDLYDTLHSLEGANFVRRHTSGRILMVDQVCSEYTPQQENATYRMLLNELLARSLETDHTYALCRCQEGAGPLRYALEQLGFVPVRGQEDIFYVDLRAPMILLQDLFLTIKEPHRDSDGVKAVVAEIRPKLRTALTKLFPGKLVLCFDSELLNQALMEQVQQLGGVQDVPPGVRRLGPYMCVPYGKILADEVVPNTVTKTLRVEKQFRPDIQSFEVVEYPGYSPLKNQIRTLKSFRRPVILVDDLLHKGYRIEKLDCLLREEQLRTHRLVVAVMSGYGRDLMKAQGRKVDCAYFIPNLHHWVTESLLYPFVGGDSIGGAETDGRFLPSINLILPYFYPNYLEDAEDGDIWALSRTALENAHALLKTLEGEHQRTFNTTLTIDRLGEAFQQPRLPDRNRSMKYDRSLVPSVYLEDDLAQLERIRRKEEKHYDL